MTADVLSPCVARSSTAFLLLQIEVALKCKWKFNNICVIQVDFATLPHQSADIHIGIYFPLFLSFLLGCYPYFHPVSFYLPKFLFVGLCLSVVSLCLSVCLSVCLLSTRYRPHPLSNQHQTWYKYGTCLHSIKELKLLKISDIFKIQCMKFWYKFKNKTLPSFFKSFF